MYGEETRSTSLDQKTMVKTELTDDLINAGESLLRHLDEQGVKTTAALWFYFTDIDAWKLVLEVPELIEKGPKAAYKKIQTILKNLDGDAVFELDDVAIARPESPVIKVLRIAVKTGPQIGGIRFSNNIINGTIIEDAYIYRLM